MGSSKELKVIITTGVQGCGKSTWSKQQAKNNPSYVRIARDDIREMLNSCSSYSDSAEKLVRQIRNDMIKTALLADKHVIVDETNVNKNNFDGICSIAESLNINANVSEKAFYVELQTAIDRNNQRTGTAKVDEDLIKKFYKLFGGDNFKNYQERSKTFSKQEKEPSKEKENVVICDIDGTIALFNKTGQQEEFPGVHFRSPFDASSSYQDKINESLKDILIQHQNNNSKIFFVTGRDESYKTVTKQWLDRYFKEYSLFMRPKSDKRKDTVVKEEIYNNEIKSKYNVVAVYEDRLQVCQLWHKLNLPLFRVGNPDANF